MLGTPAARGGAIPHLTTTALALAPPFYLPKESRAGQLLAIEDDIQQLLAHLKLTDDAPWLGVKSIATSSSLGSPAVGLDPMLSKQLPQALDLAT